MSNLLTDTRVISLLVLLTPLVVAETCSVKYYDVKGVRRQCENVAPYDCKNEQLGHARKKFCKNHVRHVSFFPRNKKTRVSCYVCTAPILGRSKSCFQYLKQDEARELKVTPSLELQQLRHVEQLQKNVRTNKRARNDRTSFLALLAKKRKARLAKEKKEAELAKQKADEAKAAKQKKDAAEKLARQKKDAAKKKKAALAKQKADKAKAVKQKEAAALDKHLNRSGYRDIPAHTTALWYGKTGKDGLEPKTLVRIQYDAYHVDKNTPITVDRKDDTENVWYGGYNVNVGQLDWRKSRRRLSTMERLVEETIRAQHERAQQH